MSLFFLRDVLLHHFDWLLGKKIIFYFLLQADLIILLLICILLYEVKRWHRIRNM